jgi:uncharacterized protein (DUF2141 family)
MGYTFAFGIGFAVLTGAWASSLVALPAAPAGIELQVHVERLRSERGVVHACLTQDRTHFPDCRADPRALRLSAPARDAGALRFENIPGGTYALAVIHDENANGQLDTFANIPREGFGFSRNPPIRFGPPRYEETRFTLAPGRNIQIIRLRYLL